MLNKEKTNFGFDKGRLIDCVLEKMNAVEKTLAIVDLFDEIRYE